MRNAARFATPLMALALGATLAACSTTGKERQPADLVSIKSPSIELRTLWSEGVGSGADNGPSGLAPQLSEDGLFVAEVGGKVAALDPATGKRRWQTQTEARVISGPAISDRLVLVGTLDGEVLALSRADGKLLWRAKASTEVLAAPVAAGNLVVARSGDGRVFGFNAETGERVWSFDRSEPTLTVRGLSSPAIDGNRVYVGMDNGRLLAANLANGEVLWEQAVSTANGRSELERLTDIDGQIISALDGLFVSSYGGDVALVDPTDGDARWKRSIKSHNGVALGRGNVYVTDASGTVWALDARTGAAAWKNESLANRHLAPPVFVGNTVLVPDFEGYVHALNPSDGSFVGRTRIGWDAIASAAAINDSTAYFQNADGKVVALQVKPR